VTDLPHLIQDLRAHAHEVKPHIGAVMRNAARELERRQSLADDEVVPPPFPPPGEDPRDRSLGVGLAGHKSHKVKGAPCA
jgi:hypothetical protein